MNDFIARLSAASDAGRHLRRKAAPAVHRTIAARAERHGSCDAARGADSVEAGTVLICRGWPVRTLTSARLTTVPTPLRLVLEAFLREELLFSQRENKFAPTVFTSENLIFQRFHSPVAEASLDATNTGQFLRNPARGMWEFMHSRVAAAIAAA